MSRSNFTGKRALITGASSGIGVEFADLLAARKVNLVLAARRREPMEKLAAELRRKYGIEVLVEPIDLASPGAGARLKNSLDERSISIDILVNNAGYGLQGDFLETPIERTVDMIQLNVTALTELGFFSAVTWPNGARAISCSSPASWRSKACPALRLMPQRRPMCSALARRCTMRRVRAAWS